MCFYYPLNSALGTMTWLQLCYVLAQTFQVLQNPQEDIDKLKLVIVIFYNVLFSYRQVNSKNFCKDYCAKLWITLTDWSHIAIRLPQNCCCGGCRNQGTIFSQLFKKNICYKGYIQLLANAVSFITIQRIHPIGICKIGLVFFLL